MLQFYIPFVALVMTLSLLAAFTDLANILHIMKRMPSECDACCPESVIADYLYFFPSRGEDCLISLRQEDLPNLFGISLMTGAFIWPHRYSSRDRIVQYITPTQHPSLATCVTF